MLISGKGLDYMSSYFCIVNYKLVLGKVFWCLCDRERVRTESDNDLVR